MSESVAPWLARDARKRALYHDDPYFWEGWSAYQALDRGRTARNRIVRSDTALVKVTFLLVKPEAFAGRRIERILDFVLSEGFELVGGWPLRMDRHATRALWRYSLNTVTIAHIRVLEMLVTSGPLVLLALRRETARDRSSVAELLSARKGTSARPPERDTLRGQLAAPAMMLNFVHAPDEPADVLRELAVLCPRDGQEEIVSALLDSDGWSMQRFKIAARSVATALTSAYTCYPAHDLDAEASQGRLGAWLRAHPRVRLPSAVRDALQTGHVAPGRALEVVRFLETARELPSWDRVVFAARLVNDLRTGRDALIG